MDRRTATDTTWGATKRSLCGHVPGPASPLGCGTAPACRRTRCGQPQRQGAAPHGRSVDKPEAGEPWERTGRVHNVRALKAVRHCAPRPYNEIAAVGVHAKFNDQAPNPGHVPTPSRLQQLELAPPLSHPAVADAPSVEAAEHHGWRVSHGRRRRRSRFVGLLWRRYGGCWPPRGSCCRAHMQAKHCGLTCARHVVLTGSHWRRAHAAFACAETAPLGGGRSNHPLSARATFLELIPGPCWALCVCHQPTVSRAQAARDCSCSARGVLPQRW